MKDNQLIRMLRATGNPISIKRAEFLEYLQSVPIILHSKHRFPRKDETDDDEL